MGEYITLSYRKKTDILREVVNHWCLLDPPGQFLWRDPLMGEWDIVCDKAVIHKNACLTLARGDVLNKKDSFRQKLKTARCLVCSGKTPKDLPQDMQIIYK